MTSDFLQQVDERAQGALASGDLQPLVTEQTELVDGGLRFLARSGSQAGRDSGADRNGNAAGQLPAVSFALSFRITSLSSGAAGLSAVTGFPHQAGTFRTANAFRCHGRAQPTPAEVA